MKYDENEMMVKEALNKINTPEYDFKREVPERMLAKQRPILVKKKLNIGLIATVIVILSGTVLASRLPSINRLISIINPEMGKILQPIKANVRMGEASVSNKKNENRKEVLGVVSEGIEIKPLAVVNDDDMMIIYLIIHDLVHDRMDETLSIEEYFVEDGMINNAQLIDYDKTCKTAIVQVTTQGGNKLNKGNISLQIGALATNKEELNQVPIGIDLDQILDKNENDTRKMSESETSGGGGTGDMWRILEDQGFIEVLKNGPMKINIPQVKGVTITNIGFINDRLHIQTKWEENTNDRHGHFYLVGKDGKKIDLKENNFYFRADNNEQEASDTSIEYILDVGKAAIKNTKLRGYFAENGEVIEGEWNLEIALDAVGEIMKIPCNIEADNWNIKEVNLTPLGITLKGKGNEGGKINCSIQMKSGETKAFDSVSTSNQGGDITMKFGMQIPLDVSAVMSIQIGETIVNLK